MTVEQLKEKFDFQYPDMISHLGFDLWLYAEEEEFIKNATKILEEYKEKTKHGK